jgi:hypothetical protein
MGSLHDEDNQPALLDCNSAILDGLTEEGVDLSSPRMIDFVMIMPDLEKAEFFAGFAKQAGHSTEIEKSDNDSMPWQVIASREMAPTAKNITFIEYSLDRMAWTTGGRSNGWGFPTKGIGEVH